MSYKRLLLSSALATMGMMPAPSQAAIEASAVRRSDGSIEVRWTGVRQNTALDLFLAPSAGAPTRQLRLLSDNDRDGIHRVQAQGTARPYFLLRTASGERLWVAERLLPLQGGRNFRDLGGYATADGRRVKWGRLYRSGTMASLSAADYNYLSRLGIASICDFRSTEERKTEPTRLPQGSKVAYWSRDYSMGSDGLKQLFASGVPTPEQVRTAMLGFYRGLPYEHAESYREMFRQLVAGNVPLAFNCSAGKDRTGGGAALVLAALGVPRATIAADYALSEKFVDYRKDMVDSSEKDGPFAFLAKLPPDIVAPLLRSDRIYIEAMLDEVVKRHGSVEAYLDQQLGVKKADLQRLRAHLLE